MPADALTREVTLDPFAKVAPSRSLLCDVTIFSVKSIIDL